MELKDYPRNEIEAALAAKNMNHRKLAVKIGRSNTSVQRAITGKIEIKGKDLEPDILKALQPELDLIHAALNQVV